MGHINGLSYDLTLRSTLRMVVNIRFVDAYIHFFLKASATGIARARMQTVINKLIIIN